jgi:cell division septation protein DedD
MKKKKTRLGSFFSVVTVYLFIVCGVLSGVYFTTQGERLFQRYVSKESLATLAETMEKIRPQRGSIKSPSEIGLYTVQVGAFRVEEEAERLQSSLRQEGYVPQVIPPAHGSVYYRLQVGDFQQQAEATQFRDELAATGYDCFVRERF